MNRKGRKVGQGKDINKRDEAEKIALFSAILQNKELIENKSFKKEDRLARELKWKEIASKLSFPGKRRDFRELRKSYGYMKSAAKMKYQSVDPTRLEETNFAMELSAADQILRRICPDFFPKFAGCHEGAGRKRTRTGTSTEEPKNRLSESNEDSSKSQEKETDSKSSDKPSRVSKKLEKSARAKNPIDVASKPDLIVEPSTSSKSLNPVAVDNIDSEMLALSLEPVENLDATSTYDFHLSQVENYFNFGKLSEQEFFDDMSESNLYPDDPLGIGKVDMTADTKKLSNIQSESTINDDPSKSIIKKNPESSPGNGKKVHGNSINLEKLDQEKIGVTDGLTTSDNPFPEFPAFELTGKRKKKPGPKQRKRRKVNKSTR